MGSKRPAVLRSGDIRRSPLSSFHEGKNETNFADSVTIEETLNDVTSEITLRTYTIIKGLNVETQYPAKMLILQIFQLFGL